MISCVTDFGLGSRGNKMSSAKLLGDMQLLSLASIGRIEDRC